MTSTQAGRTGPRAIVWVDARHAIVASTAPDGEITTELVDRGPESETEYLAHVVHEIGDQPSVGIMGPTEVCLALEREYVAISHHPDRLVGIPLSMRAGGAQVLERMERLAA